MKNVLDDKVVYIIIGLAVHSCPTTDNEKDIGLDGAQNTKKVWREDLIEDLHRICTSAAGRGVDFKLLTSLGSAQALSCAVFPR
jgi:hypothetical protein